jgi:Family of unknown function (DUF6262)
MGSNVSRPRTRATIVPPDRRPGALSADAQRKSEAASGRARNALKTLDARGAEITFQAVARAAGVSRQWLYTQPELRAEIERLRAANDEPGARRAPARERASENSLRHRNRALLDENQRLRAEIAALRQELAVALGDLRASHRRRGDRAA